MSQPAPDQERKHAGVVVPPPLIYAGVLALMLMVDYAAGGPGLGLDWTFRLVAGGVLFVAGFAIALVASAQFKMATTDVRPWISSTALVTTGLYRYTRNPMYVGLSLIYAGLALLADSAITLLALVPLVVAIHYAVIKREEHYLEVTFGQAYRDYKARVRRWI